MFGRKGHFSLARKRVGKMDRALALLERATKKGSAKAESQKLLSELKKRRAQLLATVDQMADHVDRAEARMKKLSAAGTVSWSAFHTALTKSHKALSRANHKAAKAIKSSIR